MEPVRLVIPGGATFDEWSSSPSHSISTIPEKCENSDGKYTYLLSRCAQRHQLVPREPRGGGPQRRPGQRKQDEQEQNGHQRALKVAQFLARAEVLDSHLDVG